MFGHVTFLTFCIFHGLNLFFYQLPFFLVLALLYYCTSVRRKGQSLNDERHISAFTLKDNSLRCTSTPTRCTPTFLSIDPSFICQMFSLFLNFLALCDFFRNLICAFWIKIYYYCNQTRLLLFMSLFWWYRFKHTLP